MGKIHERFKKKMQTQHTGLFKDVGEIVKRGTLNLSVYSEWNDDKSTKHSRGYSESPNREEAKFVIGYNREEELYSVVTLPTGHFHMDYYLGDGYGPLSAGYFDYDPEDFENMRLTKYSEGYCIGTSAKAFPYLQKHLALGRVHGQLSEHKKIME